MNGKEKISGRFFWFGVIYAILTMLAGLIMIVVLLSSCSKDETLQRPQCKHIGWIHKSYNEDWQLIEQDTTAKAFLCGDSLARWEPIAQNKFYHWYCTSEYDSSGWFLWN